MGEWSPSHLIVAALALATIIGQAIAVLVRLKTTTERLEKQIDKQSENMRQMSETFFHALERFEDRIDKRLSDMQTDTNHRFTEVNQRLSDMQTDTNQRLSDMQAETNHRFTEMNQRLSDMQTDTSQRFTEMNQRLSDMQTEISGVRSEMRQLNQNHIDHLNRHHVPQSEDPDRIGS